MLAKIDVWFSSRKVQKAIAKINPRYLARSPVNILRATKFTVDPPSLPFIDGEVRDLIGAHGAPAAGVVGPAKHTRLEESAIDDQLPAALEQVQQVNLALGTVE